MNNNLRSYVAQALLPAVSRLFSTRFDRVLKLSKASVGMSAGAAGRSARLTLRRKTRALAVLLLAPALFAGETRTWTQSDYSDFERGVVRNLSMRSDGLLTLAPSSRELFDASSAYLWALTQDSKGNLYAGGGTGAKIYQIPPGGKGKLLAELDALEVHALAVDSKDRVYAATSPDGKVYRIAGNGKPEVFYDPKTKYIWPPVTAARFTA